MGLNATIEASIRAKLTAAPDIGSAAYDIETRARYPLTDGVGANQANNVFSDTRTLAASASESIDLAGSLANVFGVVLTFTAIKAIYVKAAAGNTNDVVIGGAASNAFVGPFADASDKLAIKPGGCVMLVNPSAAGWTVTPSTGDLLLIANSAAGTPVSYDIVIIGEA
ncbi:hypothetical protein [Sphingomonas sanxanigenens]|uniref:Uncharacterized protein n=1 Tax=Sphingomonas sanxanigenens DSM 19645 = NX02 TaxID=1123269 RepID=W0A8I7_9SPHN|nr:hypothetical protein [Sphingomonas sanxanigenens]AHE52633.1 hypothetical protein NX02_04445 [Sphingomonas sanxanigenens DSM 19645 = NX02]